MKTVVSGIIEGKRQEILIVDGIIQAIGSISRTEMTGATLIDTEGRLIPGFIDIHVHGGGGADTMDASAEAFRTIAQAHAAHGTTALCLTTISDSVERLGKVLQTLPPSFCSGGAQILGFHLEGPFIHPQKSGAHDRRYLLTPSLELWKEWMGASQNQIKIITVAPEQSGAEELIRHASAQGVIVSLGHSNATYEQAMKGKEWGAKSVTHLFNAMNPFHHREPGLAGYALNDDDLYCELIADFYHVHPHAVQLLLRAKGTKRLCLVTDAMRAAGLADGRYEFGGRYVQVKEGKATLPDGTIAGSTLTLDRAMKNLAATGWLSWEELIRITSRNQARLLGLKKRDAATGI